MATNQSAASGGIGLGGAVFIVFLVLKLTHYIDWSWWWVTAPLWIPFGIAGAIVGLGVVLWTLGLVVGALRGARRSLHRSRE